jgi:hypothetical protein
MTEMTEMNVVMKIRKVKLHTHEGFILVELAPLPDDQGSGNGWGGRTKVSVVTILIPTAERKRWLVGGDVQVSFAAA